MQLLYKFFNFQAQGCVAEAMVAEENENFIEQCTMNCQQPCEYTEYSKMLSFLRFPSDRWSWLTFLRKYVLQIFDEQELETQERRNSQTMENRLCNLGNCIFRYAVHKYHTGIIVWKNPKIQFSGRIDDIYDICWKYRRSCWIMAWNVNRYCVESQFLDCFWSGKFSSLSLQHRYSFEVSTPDDRLWLKNEKRRRFVENHWNKIK